MTTVNFTGELAITVCWCGMTHAIPSSLYNFQHRQLDNGEKVTSVYCPLGHQHVPFGKSKVDQLEERLRRAESSRDRWRDTEAARTRQLAAARGQITKLRNKAQA